MNSESGRVYREYRAVVEVEIITRKIRKVPVVVGGHESPRMTKHARTELEAKARAAAREEIDEEADELYIQCIAWKDALPAVPTAWFEVPDLGLWACDGVVAFAYGAPLPRERDPKAQWVNVCPSLLPSLLTRPGPVAEALPPGWRVDSAFDELVAWADELTYETSVPYLARLYREGRIFALIAPRGPRRA